jgi:hypothetical protein
MAQQQWLEAATQENDMKVVTIKPRHGIDAQDISHFLRVEFQQSGTSGNPLVNADIDVVEQTDTEHEAVVRAVQLGRENYHMQGSLDDIIESLSHLVEQYKS